ncbi:MAG TPA: circularly permuted type 2 ATP-grasp protein [Polyangiaceae bacterium]|nr:circularly permuted type 2 ATP-grasp protein [Polyangiaceae bacterium]
MSGVDEFWERPGVPRAHQRGLWDFLKAHEGPRRDALNRAVQARVHEQEVTFNILGAPDGSARPWALDQTPWIIESADFDDLTARLTQRARLLSAALDDLYGEQRLLREGVVPEHLVFGNPQYFRAVHGFTPLGGQRLTLYAADVARAPSGEFRVYSDRTAAPAGSGYALENRLVLGQVLAEPFQSYRVRKVNSFFESVQGMLKSLAPQQQGAPRVVLLTPGLGDESSFEHAYLARYMGIELVEGRDLTVRGEEVFLKTLEGLKRVDVILRRVTDAYCDPLELRGDSSLGVAGLVGAARAGSVAIVNPLGSAVLETPAFKAFLPAMCEALLGEPLQLPSVDTRWCGTATMLEEVLDTFDQWTFKPAFKERRSDILDASTLSQDEREQFKKQVRGTPMRFVAERWPEQSMVPLGLGLDQSGPVGLRLFICKSNGGYSIMPGGLARVRDTPDGLFLTVQKDAVSKDVWVPSQENGEAPLLPGMPVERLQIKRGGVDMPSRLFDDMFWLGRYVERCENTTRLVRAGLEPLAVEGRDVHSRVANGILSSLFSLEILTPTTGKSPGMERLLLAAVYDGDKPNSVRSTLSRIHHLTMAVRSRLSRDAWSVLRRLTSIIQGPERPVPVDQAVEDLRELILVLAAFHGIAGSNMVRGHAWRFLEMGRRIERAVFALTLLQELFPADGSRVMMETLLNICDSLLTYRSRYLSTLQAAPVVDLLLTDDTNPQSVSFQVARLLESVRALPRESLFPLSRAEQRLILFEARLVTADLDKACASKGEGLRELAEEGVNLMWQVSDDLSQTYFTHAKPSRAMAPALWIDENLEAR